MRMLRRCYLQNSNLQATLPLQYGYLYLRVGSLSWDLEPINNSQSLWDLLACGIILLSPLP